MKTSSGTSSSSAESGIGSDMSSSVDVFQTLETDYRAKGFSLSIACIQINRHEKSLVYV